jgi:Ran GTPase-activating protein (RanGAP) involved in mRNA processing and transport
LRNQLNLESEEFNPRLGNNAFGLLQRALLVSDSKLCELPPLDDASLGSTFEKWLTPFINKSTQLDHLPWQQGLEFLLGYDTL